MYEKVRSIYSNRSHKFIGNNHFLTTVLFILWISVPTVLLMKKLRLWLHPTAITLTSFAAILSAAYFFYEDRLVNGAILFLIFLVLDDVDGMWARLTERVSELGGKLDWYFCHIGTVAMYFGIWHSQYYLKDEAVTGVLLIVSRYIVALSLQVFLQSSGYKTIFPRVNSYYTSQEEKFGTFFIAPLLGIVNILLPILILIQLISFLVLFVRQKQRPNFMKRLKERIILR